MENFSGHFQMGSDNERCRTKKQKKRFADQERLITTNRDYKVPQILLVTIGILVEHVITQTHLYPYEPLTGTRCAEKTQTCRLDVGGFGVDGLIVGTTSKDEPLECVGMAAIRFL